MDQTGFSLLVGLLVGGPIATVAIGIAFDPTKWVAIPLGYTLGTLLLAILVSVFIDWVGRRTDQSDKPNDDSK